jgi:hypothetical protein
MFYIRLADNKYPLTETQVRAAFPNTSFPKDLGEPEGYAAIVFKPAPAVDQTLQQVVETTPALVNGEYAQQWRVLNLTAEDVEAKRLASVPAIVTPRQIRQTLSAFGLRSAVEDAVAAGSLDIQDWWNYASEFERSNTQVNAMATQLGVTPLQLDDLFVAASKI